LLNANWLYCPPTIQAKQYIYDRVIQPERQQAVTPPFSKPDTPWPEDWWGRETGFQRGWYDPGSSEALFHWKDREDDPRDYWLPKYHPFDEIDLEAFDEQAFHNYTPYAVGTLPYAVYWRKMSLTPGVYQFKLGQWDDGSYNTHLRQSPYRLPDYTFLGNSPLRRENEVLQKRETLKQRTYGTDKTPQAIGEPPRGLTLKEHDKLQRRQDVIIATQGGKVMALFPVEEKIVYPEAPKTTWGLAYRNNRHEQWGALSPVDTLKARVDESAGRPRTRFLLDVPSGRVRLSVCQKHVCYETWLYARDVYAYSGTRPPAPPVKPSSPGTTPPEDFPPKDYPNTEPVPNAPDGSAPPPPPRPTLPSNTGILQRDLPLQPTIFKW
jgi:hypothetical protein